MNVEDYWPALVEAIGGSQCELNGVLQPFNRGIAQVIAELNGRLAFARRACWLFGNGGSATIADHIACDMLIKGWRAVALTNAALLTSLGNDHGYEFVFARQLQKLAQDGDVLIGMSCSGESSNVAAAFINAAPAYRIGLTGFRKDNGMRQMRLDAQFWVPSDDYGVVQIAHLAILHAIVDLASSVET